MRKLAICGALPLVLAGCGAQPDYSSEPWMAQKPQCAAGDAQVCAEIGHQVRAAMGGVTQPRTWVISEPIID